MREMVEAALERYLLALAGPGATGEVTVVRDSLGIPTVTIVVAVLISSSGHVCAVLISSSTSSTSSTCCLRGPILLSLT